MRFISLTLFNLFLFVKLLTFVKGRGAKTENYEDKGGQLVAHLQQSMFQDDLQFIISLFLKKGIVVAWRYKAFVINSARRASVQMKQANLNGKWYLKVTVRYLCYLYMLNAR